MFTPRILSWYKCWALHNISQTTCGKFRVDRQAWRCLSHWREEPHETVVQSVLHLLEVEIARVDTERVLELSSSKVQTPHQEDGKEGEDGNS